MGAYIYFRSAPQIVKNSSIGEANLTNTFTKVPIRQKGRNEIKHCALFKGPITDRESRLEVALPYGLCEC